MTCNNDCNTDCNCENAVASPSILYDTEDCGTCGGLNTTWTMENFYRASIRTKITATQLPPFDIDVNKLPYSPKGLMTLSPNTDREEVVEYEYTNGQANSPGTLTILKRGIHPGALNLIVDGEGGNSNTILVDNVEMEVSPEYNNCNFMFEHLTNSEVQRDITAQDFNIFSRYTCCIPATTTSLGIVALTTPPDNPDFPIAVGANDFANGEYNSGILRGLTKLVPAGEEIAVSWNDYANATNAGIVYIKDLEIEQITCGDGNISTTVADGFTPQTALHANQRAFKNVYGSVRLSKSQADSIALSALDYAGSNNAGIVKIKTVNSNPTCNLQATNSQDECPAFATEVVQKNDFANTTESGLVFLSKELNDDLPCPIVVTKHDFATTDNTGIVRVKNDCPQGDGYNIVPSMCTYSDYDLLGITYQSVATDDCNTVNVDSPTTSTPISTSTNDKRNFHQVTVYNTDFTLDNGVKGRGLFVDNANINSLQDEIPFRNGDIPSETNIITNTGAQSGTAGINEGGFYCYGDMVQVEQDGDISRVLITQDGFYSISAEMTIVNTKSQLEDTSLGNSSTVTYSMSVSSTGILPVRLSDIEQIHTTIGDVAYNASDPLYGEPVRACTLDDDTVTFLQAGDELWLSPRFDQIDCYVTNIDLRVYCIQPNL